MYVGLATERLSDWSILLVASNDILLLQGLVGSGTGLERAVHDRLKRRHLHVLVMVDLVEYVEGYDSLSFGQHL